jgi:glutathione S-transferase
MSLLIGLFKAMGEIAHLDDVHSWASSTVRGPRGVIVRPHNQKNPPRPDKPLELYEFEGCPFCRKVREAMTELDLSYVTRVSPKGARSNREFVKARGGKEQFPYLVDPNTSRELFESEDIISYLAETYGSGRLPLGRILSPVNTANAMAASLVRPRGSRVRPGLEDREKPSELLVLYNIEGSPFCRKVREVLNELNLDYVTENVGKFSARRPELIARGGKMMVPYLIDPNTDTQMYESDDIVAYLEKTYGT